jgi:hypothetical protein
MDYNSKLSTKHISHFTKEFENIKKIVEEGFKPHECEEFAIDEQPTESQKILINWYAFFFGKTEDDYIAGRNRTIPMVCFCDIPLKLTEIHRKRYGKYAIMLTKQWAIKHEINPLIYAPQNSTIHSLFNGINSIVDTPTRDPDCPETSQLREKIKRLHGYIKPYMNEAEDYKYYDEREWRYVPMLNGENKNLEFQKQDFVRAIVQTAEEKRELLRVLRAKFGKIQNDMVKIKKNTINKQLKTKQS